VADVFLRLTLKDGSTHAVVVPEGASAEGLVAMAAKGQRWAESGWIEVEGGGAVTRRLVAASEVVQIELFERPD
jgi:hypothetical protein